jgi:hypothetical protein
MVIRRIVGTALAAAALAGAVGVAVAPNAAAQPRQCSRYITVVESWHDQYEWSMATYGANDSRTQYADQQATKALARQINAGC